MKSLKAYAIAAHFGPTMLITTISFLLAARLWWEGPAYLIAFTVFLGQLLIGWSNDIYDYQDDLKHNRVNKPLVSGQLQIEDLKKATFILLPIALLANLLGPLGLKGGAVYLLGVGCGIAYNFYFKFSVFSPLPYAIAFAALPSSIAISKGITPPLWMLLGGSIFGMAAHFINVIKDMEEDQVSGIQGLPQRLGTKRSVIVAITLLSLGVLALYLTM